MAKNGRPSTHLSNANGFLHCLQSLKHNNDLSPVSLLVKVPKVVRVSLTTY